MSIKIPMHLYSDKMLVSLEAVWQIFLAMVPMAC